MCKLTECVKKPVWIWLTGGLGKALLIVGIVTAAMNVTIAGFTPVTWLLLALACYSGIICVVTMRILDQLESKAEG